MLTNNATFKYEMPYNGPFEIKCCHTNLMVILQCDAIKIMYNICHINPYTSYKKVEDVTC